MLSSISPISAHSSVYASSHAQETPLENKAAKTVNTLTAAETLHPVEDADKASLKQGKDLDKTASEKNNNDDSELNHEEQAVISKLKQRDTEVKAHEQAHLSAAGGLATGGASFSYQTGPNGKRYAIGGEVGIDTSGGSTPEETLRKADTIKRAALAPANPSSQDIKVAAKATNMANKARLELLTANQDNENPDKNNPSPLGSLIDHTA